MGNKKVTVTGLGGPEVLRVVEDADLPEPGPGEVRVRVEASSAVFTDTLIRRGLYPYLDPASPFTLGYDFVGRVDALGDGVAGLAVGQRVADLPRLGANAEYVVRPAERLVPVPDSVDPAEAESMVLSYMTAHQMLHRVAGAQRGQRVLVQGGAGAVGNALVVLGRRAGLEVVATASAGNLDLLKERGAIAVDYRAPDLAGQLGRVADGGFDAAFDGVGLWSQRLSFRLLSRQDGVLVTYGAVAPARGVRRRSAVTRVAGPLIFLAGSAGASLYNALPGGRSVRSYEISEFREERPDWFAEDLGSLFGLLAAGEIEPAIAGRLPLDEASRAHEMIDGGGVRGRLVLVADAVPQTPDAASGRG